jgi:hypothetical protein
MLAPCARAEKFPDFVFALSSEWRAEFAFE